MSKRKNISEPRLGTSGKKNRTDHLEHLEDELLDFQNARDIDLLDDDTNSEYEGSHESLVDSLAKEWLLVEICHDVSKTASNAFWRLALNLIPKIEAAKTKNSKKILQFQQVRNRLYQDNVPSIDMEIAYQNTENKEIKSVRSTTTPLSTFPPATYTKLYEVATVKVNYNII